MKELKVGERVTITLEAVEHNTCEGCFFEGSNNKCGAEHFYSPCGKLFRSDGKSIIFKKLSSKECESKRFGKNIANKARK